MVRETDEFLHRQTPTIHPLRTEKKEFEWTIWNGKEIETGPIAIPRVARTTVPSIWRTLSRSVVTARVSSRVFSKGEKLEPPLRAENRARRAINFLR